MLPALTATIAVIVAISDSAGAAAPLQMAFLKGQALRTQKANLETGGSPVFLRQTTSSPYERNWFSTLSTSDWVGGRTSASW